MNPKSVEPPVKAENLEIKKILDLLLRSTNTLNADLCRQAWIFTCTSVMLLQHPPQVKGKQCQTNQVRGKMLYIYIFMLWCSADRGTSTHMRCFQIFDNLYKTTQTERKKNHFQPWAADDTSKERKSSLHLDHQQCIYSSRSKWDELFSLQK